MKRLPDVVTWAETHTTSTALLIGDYLQRHNEMVFEGASAEVAENNISQTVERICSDVSAMRASYRPSELLQTILTRELAANSEFRTRVARFSNLYRERSDFREKIDTAVASYLKRRKKSITSNEAAWRHCVSYQTEELAMFEIMAGRGYATLIYPGPQLPVMRAIVSGAVDNISPSIQSMNLIELRFIEEQIP